MTYHDQGDTVRTTARAARTPNAMSGRFALLAGVLHVRGGGARKTRVLASMLAFGLALAGALALTATPALAQRAWVFTGSFGGSGSTTPASGAETLGEPWSVAVATAGPSDHDVYVADGENHRVEKFGPKGEFLLMFGKEVNKTEHDRLGLNPGETTAQKEAREDVCDPQTELLVECQAGTAGTTPGAFGGAREPGLLYVAVDDSSGPSAGDVYVGDLGVGVVSKFTEEGALVSSWGDNGPGGSADGQLNGPSGESFNGVFGVAVDPAGSLWVYGDERMFEFGQEGASTTSWPVGEGIIDPPHGIAVDAQDDLYIEAARQNAPYGEKNRGLHEFSAAGEEIGWVVRGTREETSSEGFTVDPVTGDVYAAEPVRDGSVERYDSSCHPALTAPCSPVETFSSAHLQGLGQIPSLGIDSSASVETLYAAEDREGAGGEVAGFALATVPGEVATVKASGLTGTSAVLNGTVNPSGEPVTECFFEWGTTESYGGKAPCEEPSAGELTGTARVPVKARIEGLTPGVTYHFRLVAGNANDVNSVDDEPQVGKDVVFGPPVLLSESATEVTNDSVTLAGEVDPQNADTHAVIEYLPASAFVENGDSWEGARAAVKVPALEADLGSGAVPVVFSEHVSGLISGTVYRYRVVSDSVLGLVVGERGAGGEELPHTFTTRGTGEFELPDDRQWQMVSPPEKQGALIEPINEAFVIQAAADGDAVTYAADAPTEPAPAGYNEFTQVFSTRTSTGWSSRDLSVPHSAYGNISIGEGYEYRAFSEDLSQAALQPFGPFIPCEGERGEQQPCLSSFASGQTAFLEDTGDRTFTPLAVSCPASGPCASQVEEHANQPPGSVTYSPEEQCTADAPCGPRFRGATPDLSHVVLGFGTPQQLKAERFAMLGEWSAGVAPGEQLRDVSLLPPNEKGEVLPAGGPQLGNAVGTVERDAISKDGSRVVWSAGGHLYLRENATQPQSPVVDGKCSVASDACTVQLDEGLPGEEPEFQTASGDDSRIFFTEKVNVRRNGNFEPVFELYVYEVGRGSAVALAQELTGEVVGASEDGSFVYFVSDAQLAPGVPVGTCLPASSPGRVCDLYVMHDNGVEWEAAKLVAVLSNEDKPDWEENLASLTGRVSPDGRWLAFMSKQSLTGYDNRDSTSGEPDEEVFLYHAPESLAAGSGTLACASCNPTGQRPHGIEYGENGNGGAPAMPLAGGFQVWPGATWIAANVPGWTPNRLSHADYQSRYLSDSGRLFFNSSDALVPKDVNGVGDVYEYEPEGVGTCSSASSSGSTAYEPRQELSLGTVRPAGCVSLISSGESSQESAFLDASAGGGEGEGGEAGSLGGGDVFFLTSGKLAPQDNDDALDVYDAHECTSASPCLPEPAQQPPACETEASCKAAPEPQPGIYGPPPSATFNGPGNVAPEPGGGVAKKKVVKKAAKCSRGKVRNKHKRCVKSNGHKAKKASGDRRAK
jgi:WD40-like Beta Propeller Repeat